MKPRDQLQVTPEQRTDLIKFLSRARMSSYSSAVPADVTASFDEIDLYVYNMALSGAFLGPLHLLEVVTRNAMHQQMTAYFGHPEWWNLPGIPILKQQLDRITLAEDQLSGQRNGIPFSPDDVVAALGFGFWLGLLGKGRPWDPVYDYGRKVWQPALRHAFPGFRGDRNQLYVKMDIARKLRNRIGHHEPIHASNQEQEYENVYRLLSYVNRPIANWMDDRSRLRSVAACLPGKPENPDAICYF